MPPEGVKVVVTDGPIAPIDPGTMTDSSDGAAVVFYGVVRGETDGRSVESLDYESYAELAKETIVRIAEEARRKWNVGTISVVHRTGKLNVGEISVVVAATAPHRAEAFDACRYVIETLKESAPIWKKELFSDGSSRWVNNP